MLLGLPSRNNDNLPVYINGYTTITPFREKYIPLGSNYCLISIDTIMLDKVLTFYL